MTHAYSEIYLDDAMDTLGGAVEYAVLFANLDGQEFLNYFLTTDIAKEFGKGNVKYISGMSGIELCLLILHKVGLTPPQETELTYINYPPEYWVGWILAYYQWHTGKSFTTILSKLTYNDIYNCYKTLHEATPQKAVEVFNNILRQKESNLARQRKLAKFSQSELAKAANISIRSIQLYEQRQTDINKAQYNHLDNIAKVLNCNIENILE